MKMPSTYISLLLFSGLLLMFCYNNHRVRVKAKPASARPVVKEMRPVVKEILLPGSSALSLDKDEKKGFSFFRDVLGHIVPALKDIE